MVWDISNVGIVMATRGAIMDIKPKNCALSFNWRSLLEYIRVAEVFYAKLNAQGISGRNL